MHGASGRGSGACNVYIELLMQPFKIGLGWVLGVSGSSPIWGQSLKRFRLRRQLGSLLRGLQAHRGYLVSGIAFKRLQGICGGVRGILRGVWGGGMGIPVSHVYLPGVSVCFYPISILSGGVRPRGRPPRVSRVS